MNLLLTRYSYSPTETEGQLIFGGERLWTIEQPWVDTLNGVAYASGAPHRSCIPEATYEMEPFTRPNGQRTWVLINKNVGVYAYQGDRANDHDRFLCLLHPANYVDQIEGCIAPGLARVLMRNAGNDNKHERAVSSSGSAMTLLRDTLGELSAGHTLQIVQERGALYGGE